MVGSIVKLLMVLAACTLALGGNDGGRYLVRVGPTQLRFKEMKPMLDPAKVLPVLVMQDAPAPAVEELGPPVPLINADEIFGTDWAPLEYPAEVQTNNVPPAPAQSPINPQMLLRYFNSTGNREVLVPAPVEFTPPAPPASSGGSSAVYISPDAK